VEKWQLSWSWRLAFGHCGSQCCAPTEAKTRRRISHQSHLLLLHTLLFLPVLCIIQGSHQPTKIVSGPLCSICTTEEWNRRSLALRVSINSSCPSQLRCL
jgi:hypothetical protein